MHRPSLHGARMHFGIKDCVVYRELQVELSLAARVAGVMGFSTDDASQ